jgi:hypothetical protein
LIEEAVRMLRARTYRRIGTIMFFLVAPCASVAQAASVVAQDRSVVASLTDQNVEVTCLDSYGRPSCFVPLTPETTTTGHVATGFGLFDESSDASAASPLAKSVQLSDLSTFPLSLAGSVIARADAGDVCSLFNPPCSALAVFYVETTAGESRAQFEIDASVPTPIRIVGTLQATSRVLPVAQDGRVEVRVLDDLGGELLAFEVSEDGGCGPLPACDTGPVPIDTIVVLPAGISTLEVTASAFTGGYYSPAGPAEGLTTASFDVSIELVSATAVPLASLAGPLGLALIGLTTALYRRRRHA